MELLTTFLLYAVADGNRYGVRHLLENFWEDAERQGIELPTPVPVSASAICQARQRLPEDIFRELLSALADQVDSAMSERRWHGRRVLAADGALVNVQRGSDLIARFGVAQNCYTPQIRYSVLVDVVSRMPVDYAAGGRMQVGEREQLFEMFTSLRRGDLLLLDRGYPSFDVLDECVGAGVDFIIRSPSSQTFKFIDEFRASGASEAVIDVDLKQSGLDSAIKTAIRLVRVESGIGPAFYITSLDRASTSPDDIAQLYRLRWEVEEFFKLATGEYAGQKQFRSMTPAGVMQEIGALTLFLALSRVLACEAESDAELQPNEFISQKAAVLALNQHLIGLLLDGDPARCQLRIERAIGRLQRTPDKRRPSRKFRRVSLRPRRKWGPRGKTRA
jgi:hypothetical protein